MFYDYTQFRITHCAWSGGFYWCVWWRVAVIGLFCKKCVGENQDHATLRQSFTRNHNSEILCFFAIIHLFLLAFLIWCIFFTLHDINTRIYIYMSSRTGTIILTWGPSSILLSVCVCLYGYKTYDTRNHRSTSALIYWRLSYGYMLYHWIQVNYAERGSISCLVWPENVHIKTLKAQF